MRKRLMLLLIFIFGLQSLLKAQSWGGGVDDDKISWGFSFQYVSSELKLVKKSNWRAPYFDADLGAYVTDSLAAISSPPTTGFGIGFLVNASITRNLDLRFTPTLVFNDRVVNYNYAPGAVNPSTTMVQKKNETTVVDFPLNLKLKSDRLMNFKPYMLGGIKYSMDLVSGKKNNDENAAPVNKLLKSRQSFLSYEAGLGLEIYFEWFKMSPELKLSYSLKDVLQHEPSPYANPIEQARLRHFTFSLYFQ